MGVCRKLLNLPIKFAGQKLLGKITKNVLGNAKTIYGHETVVRDRSYRISCLELFDQIQD